MKKIRVLHVFNIMNVGGAETFIMNVFRNIDRNKFEFYFLCLSNDSGKYDDEIISLGGHIIHFKDFKKIRIFNTIKSFKRLLLDYEIDVVHLPIHFYSGIFCISSYYAGIKKIIVHSHSAGDEKNNKITKIIYQSVMRYIIKKYSTVKLACGKAAGNYLYGKNTDYEVMYNGIDLEKFKNISQKSIDILKKEYSIKDEIIIGHIGRFVPIKNHCFFVKLAEELIKEKIKFKIVFVGDGEEREKVENVIKEKQLEKFFIFTGLQMNVPLYCSLFDVFVMPSLYEGFPVTIIESLACGVPCVISDTITDEVNIIDDYVRFRNLDDSIDLWCKDIISLSKLNKNKNMCLNKLEVSNFSIKTVVKRLECLYENK